MRPVLHVCSDLLQNTRKAGLLQMHAAQENRREALVTKDAIILCKLNVWLQGVGYYSLPSFLEVHLLNFLT